MNQLDIRAAILRIHNDHAISCSADAENDLVKSLEDLQLRGQLTRVAVQKAATQMSSQFYKNNGLDSPAQYGRLLWEGISVARPPKPTAPTITSETHFHAPVQAGLLQTGAGSTAQWLGNNQVLAFRRNFQTALETARSAAEAELVDDKKEEALAIIDAAEAESDQDNPDRSKLKRLLTPLLKWSGDRFTNAIDAALGAVIATALKPGP